MVLSKSEELLYVELAAQIAVYFPKSSLDELGWGQDQPRKDRFDIKNSVIDHGFLSDFEAACEVLHRLGVLLPLKGDGSLMDDETSWSACFQIKFDLPELRAVLSKDLPPSAPPLSEVIKVFLSLVTDYGNQVSTRRAPFQVEAGLQPAFELLARCEYVEQIGDEFAWTDKIADTMRAIFRWTDDGIPRKDLFEAEIDEMWRTLPTRIRKMFFSGGPVDVISLSIVISKCWSGGKWQEANWDAGQKDILMSGDSLPRARGLEKRYRGSSS